MLVPLVCNLLHFTSLWEAGARRHPPLKWFCPTLEVRACPVPVVTCEVDALQMLVPLVCNLLHFGGGCSEAPTGKVDD